MSVIIMEGPDGCGKTNIGKRLSHELCWDYFKVDSEKRHWKEGKFKEALEFDQTYLVQFLSQVHCDVVIDRAYPSEYVYSAVFRRQTNEKLIKELDKKFAELDTTIILLVRRDYTNVEDELVKGTDFLGIHYMYQAFYDFTACNCIMMYVDDYDNDINKQMPKLLEALSKIEQDDSINKIIITE